MGGDFFRLFLHVTFTTINSNKTTIHPLFIVTKQHTTLVMILPRMYMYDVMQWLLHEEAPFFWFHPYIQNTTILSDNLPNLFLIASAASFSPHLYTDDTNSCHDAFDVFLIHQSSAISTAYWYASSSCITALIFSFCSKGTFKMFANKLHLLLKLNPHSWSNATALLGVKSITNRK